MQVHNSLQTNGLAVNEEWCEFFKENNFLIGLSVDGTEETHNSLRHTKSGEDTFSRIYESAKLMDKYQVEYNILTVVTKNIAENIKISMRHIRSVAGTTSSISPVLIL